MHEEIGDLVKGLKTSFIREMFIETADQNYVVARFCFLNGLNTDFYWLALHALEKYYKAVCLLEGVSCKKLGHDIVKLYKRAKECVPIAFSDSFEAPPFLASKDWHPESIESFIERLNWFGDPHNRYQSFGYYRIRDELLKVDQLVYGVRRAIHVLRYPLEERNSYGKEYLKRREIWNLWAGGYLEQAAASKKGKAVLDNFKKYNYLFFPEEANSVFQWTMSCQVSPFDLYINNMLETGGDLEKRQARALVDWLLDEVKLPNDRRVELEGMQATGPKLKRDNPL